MKSKKRVFIITLVILLIITFRPIKPPKDTAVQVYQIGVDIPEGDYLIRPVGEDVFHSYQIATSSNMSAESTTASFVVKKDSMIKLKNGEYIKLVNCACDYIH